MRNKTRKLPARVLYILSGAIVVVFALFWLVGFDKPYDEDPNFTAPLFTDLLMALMIAMLAGSAAIIIWAVARHQVIDRRHFRTANRKETHDNNIPARKLGYCVSGGTTAVLALTFALGSSEPMKINGTGFGDTLWLKMADMFVCTSAILILAAAIAVAYGSTKYIRKP